MTRRTPTRQPLLIAGLIISAVFHIVVMTVFVISYTPSANDNATPPSNVTLTMNERSLEVSIDLEQSLTQFERNDAADSERIQPAHDNIAEPESRTDEPHASLITMPKMASETFEEYLYDRHVPKQQYVPDGTEGDIVAQPSEVIADFRRSVVFDTMMGEEDVSEYEDYSIHLHTNATFRREHARLFPGETNIRHEHAVVTMMHFYFDRYEVLLPPKVDTRMTGAIFTFDTPHRTLYKSAQSARYYLTRYPDGPHTEEALLVLAKALIELKQDEYAIEAYVALSRYVLAKQGVRDDAAVEEAARAMAQKGKRHGRDFSVEVVHTSRAEDVQYRFDVRKMLFSFFIPLP